MSHPRFLSTARPLQSMTRRTLVGAAVAAVGIRSLRLTTAQDATPLALASPVAIPEQPLPYLFIQTADQGSWQPMRGQPGSFLLTLSSVSPQTIVIRDEPSDAAGVLSTALLLDSIRFSAERPLQGVVSVESSTGQDVLVVSLSRATYDPSIEELVYVATKLDDYTDEHGIDPLKAQSGNFTLSADFGATTLFITNAYCRDESGGSCKFG